MVDHAIILNPIAGKGKKATGSIEEAKKYLDELKVSYKIFETEYAQHAIELASQCAKDGYRGRWNPQ